MITRISLRVLPIRRRQLLLDGHFSKSFLGIHNETRWRRNHLVSHILRLHFELRRNLLIRHLTRCANHWINLLRMLLVHLIAGIIRSYWSSGHNLWLYLRLLLAHMWTSNTFAVKLLMLLLKLLMLWVLWWFLLILVLVIRALRSWCILLVLTLHYRSFLKIDLILQLLWLGHWEVINRHVRKLLSTLSLHHHHLKVVHLFLGIRHAIRKCLFLRLYIKACIRTILRTFEI